MDHRTTSQEASPNGHQKSESAAPLGSPQLETIIASLAFHKNGLAKHRDALRELQSEIEEMADIAADAADNLMYAIDRLSEQV